MKEGLVETSFQMENAYRDLLRVQGDKERTNTQVENPT